MIPADIGAAPLTEEQAKALAARMARMAQLGEQNSVVEEQMAQALALREPSNRQYYGAAAGAVGGIGDALRQIQGVVKGNRAYDERARLSNELKGERTAYNEAATRAAAAGQAKDDAFREAMLAAALRNGAPTIAGNGQEPFDPTVPFYARQPMRHWPKEVSEHPYFGFGGR